jgi:hypothetical protein
MEKKVKSNVDLELYNGETIELEKEIEEDLFKRGRNSTCKIITKESNATGFFCKIPYYKKIINVLFTNNHILNEKMIEVGNKIHFVYKLKRKMIEITSKRICLTNQLLDYTIIEIFDDDGNKVLNLNDLVNVEEYFYINVYMSDKIIKVDMKGKIIKTYVFDNLIEYEIKMKSLDSIRVRRGDVLNGIAYNKKNNSFLITGKKWGFMYEIKFIK